MSEMERSEAEASDGAPCRLAGCLPLRRSSSCNLGVLAFCFEAQPASRVSQYSFRHLDFCFWPNALSCLAAPVFFGHNHGNLANADAALPIPTNKEPTHHHVEQLIHSKPSISHDDGRPVRGMCPAGLLPDPVPPLPPDLQQGQPHHHRNDRRLRLPPVDGGVQPPMAPGPGIAP